MAERLSGAAYVPMRLREDGERVKATPTKISVVKFCEHKFTICTECAGDWTADYVIYWSRTAGGRRLREQLREVT